MPALRRSLKGSSNRGRAIELFKNLSIRKTKLATNLGSPHPFQSLLSSCDQHHRTKQSQGAPDKGRRRNFDQELKRQNASSKCLGEPFEQGEKDKTGGSQDSKNRPIIGLRPSTVSLGQCPRSVKIAFSNAV